MTVITTSTASTATAYSNQRKIDRCQNGVLWAMFWDGTSTTSTSMDFYYSTDDGATWTKGGEFGFAGTGTTYVPNGSMFIDLDDYAHVVYKDRHDGKVYYRRGTPNAGRTSWAWTSASTIDSGTGADYPDVVAHREGTDWVAHVAFSYADSAPTNYALHKPVTITSGGTITVGEQTVLGGSYALNVHTFPSIDFNHTGDSKTIAGSTPHLYVAWSAGATGAGKGIRFKKATYSGGTWTWGTEREIDSTRYVTDPTVWLNCLFDGTRVVLPGMPFDGAANDLVVYERDAADTATTTRVLVNNAASGDLLTYGSSTYDGDGNLHLFGSGPSPYPVRYRKWTRATTTLGAVEEVDSGASTPYLSAKRGYSGDLIEFIYTDGTASPYSVTYDSIALTTPPSTGTASGTLALGGSAVGFTPPNSGTAAGSITITGSAVGEAPIITVPTGTATGALALGGAAVGVTPDQRFTPPTFEERMPATAGRLFSFFAQTMSYAVVWRNGHYQTVRVPSQEETDLLVEGRTWFSGGRTYDVDADTATLLVADGFEVT